MTNLFRRSFRSSALVGLGLLLNPAQASNIAVIRTTQEVVIAADSAGVIQGDGLAATKESVCKIYRIDDALFFAVSGLVNDPRSGYRVPVLVDANSRGRGTISEKLENVERVVSPALLREAGEVKSRDPEGYGRLVDSKGALSVIMIGIENGIPSATSFSIGLTRTSDGTIQTTVVHDSCPGNCPSGVRAFSIGASPAIDAVRRRGGLPSLSMADLADYMVQAEIDAGTVGVAGPVDVLRLTTTGPIWVRQKASCPASIATDSH